MNGNIYMLAAPIASQQLNTSKLSDIYCAKAFYHTSMTFLKSPPNPPYNQF